MALHLYHNARPDLRFRALQMNQPVHPAVAAAPRRPLNRPLYLLRFLSRHIPAKASGGSVLAMNVCLLFHFATGEICR